jgi:hypothetical protein
MKRALLLCILALMTGMFAGRPAHGLPPLYSENFDGLPLGPPVDEDWPFPNAYTHTPPPGVMITNNLPGVGNPDIGVTEWEGWSFANKDFWIDVSRGEGRQFFTLGSGTIAVADTDEWNDLGNPADNFGFYKTMLKTPVIDLLPADKMPLKLQFDSSWRGECCDDGERFDANGNNQTAVLTMYTDVGGPIELLRWESAPFRHPVTGRPSTDPNHLPNPFHKANALNEKVLVDLRAALPVGATEASLEFMVADAGDDGWWAADNASVFPLTTILGDMNINDVLDPDDFFAYALGLRSTSAYRAEYFGEFPVTRGSADSIFDFDDIDWFLDIMEQGGVLPSGAALAALGRAIPEPSAALLFIIGIAVLFGKHISARHALASG